MSQSAGKDPDQHTEEVNQLFSRMARWYDIQNHVFSLGLDYWWRYNLARAVVPGPRGVVLDLAAGTLDVTMALSRRYPDLKIIAADISAQMLEYGLKHKVKLKDADRISTLVADARSLPLEGNSMDAVTIAFGIRNVNPRAEALAEMYRVLAPGGRACVLEFSPLTIPVLGPAYHWHIENVLPWLAGKISDSAESFCYLAQSIKDFPAPKAFCEELRAVGFPYVQYESFCLGVANLYVAIKA